MINTFYFHLSTFNFHIMLYERTLGQWLEHWAETTPDKEYIVYSDRNLRFTWSQFNRRVDDMAKGLIAIGVERGTHVGIWAANVPDWLTLLYACAKIGAVYVTVNTNYKQSELEYLCQNSDMHTLCIVNGEKDSDFVQMTYTMLPELKTCQRGHLKSERFPYMKNVIYVGQEKHRGMYNTAEILLLGNNIEDSRLNELKSQVTCHDVVNMQYTSGTTGFPKGVMLTHYNIANNGFLTGKPGKFKRRIIQHLGLYGIYLIKSLRGYSERKIAELLRYISVAEKHLAPVAENHTCFLIVYVLHDGGNFGMYFQKCRNKVLFLREVPCSGDEHHHYLAAFKAALYKHMAQKPPASILIIRAKLKVFQKPANRAYYLICFFVLSHTNGDGNYFVRR